MNSDRYTVLRPLTGGASGRVWLVQDQHENSRHVVLKQLNMGMDSALLSNEFEVLRHLHHPNVANVADFELGNADDPPFLTEAYVDGPALDCAMQDQPIDTKIRVLVQVLRALEYVHARGVIHGDVKPDNILVSQNAGDFCAKLIDFGLAGGVGTGSDGISGTPGYVAPEIIRGGERTVQSDLYSFGATAYKVLTGQSAFAAETMGATMQAQLSKLPDAPSNVNTSLLPTVDAVLLRLLSINPEDRPKSAREARNELGAAFHMSWEEETAETLKAYLTGGRIVGREAELLDAQRLRESATKTQTNVRLLWWVGDTGTGRSRLLREIAGDAQLAGTRVALAHGAHNVALGVGYRWLEGLQVSSQSVAGARDRWEAIGLAADSIIEHATHTPTLLLLDDSEQADDLSLDLIRVLCEQISASCAGDQLETRPNLSIIAVGSQPPSGLEALSEHSYSVEALRPLEHHEVGSWISSLLPAGSALPDDFVDGLFRLTQGVPGHVVLMLATLVDRKLICLKDGELVVAGNALSEPLPESVAAAVTERELRLAPQDKNVLQTMRCLFGPSDISGLGAIMEDLSQEDLRAVLHRLKDRGFVADLEGTPVRYIADGPVGDLTANQQRDLHVRIYRAMVESGDKGTSSARHLREAVCLGDDTLKKDAFTVLKAAADSAKSTHNLSQELQFLRWALDCAISRDEQHSIGIRLADQLRQLGQYGESAVEFQRVLDTDASDEFRPRAVLGLAAVEFDRGEYPSALERVQTGDFHSESQPAAAACAGSALMMMGRYEDALTCVRDGLKQSGTVADQVKLRATEALVYYYTEQPEEALRSFEAGASFCRDAGDLVGEAVAVNGMGLVHHRRGEFGSAAKAYQSSLSLAQQSGDAKRIAVAAMNIGTVLHETGKVTEAAARYRESLKAAQLLGDGAGVARAASNLGNLLIHMNRLEEAKHWLERSTREAGRLEQALLVAYNQALLGKVMHRLGDLDGARREVHTALSRLRELGNAGEAGELLIELGLIARTAGDCEGITHFAKAAQQQCQSSGADKHLAYVAFLEGEASRLSGDSEKAIASLLRALNLADRHRLFDLGWMCEGGLARAYRSMGNGMEAQARFHACSERIFAQASELGSRARDVFLADSQRATLIEESRLVARDDGTQSSGASDQHERLVRLMAVNSRLVSERDLQRLLEFILDSAIALTGAERGFVILSPEADSGHATADFEVRAARNIDHESLRRNQARVSRSITMEVLQSGEPVVTIDAGEDERFREVKSVHHLRLRSILCFPLQTHGTIVGAIYLDNRFQKSTFSDRELELISSFADQAAVAITNAQLHERNQRAHDELKESYRRIESLNSALEERVSEQADRLAEIEVNLASQRRQLETRYRYDNIIGSSPAMQKIFSVLDRVTDTNVPVLIQGESGTGKELVARAVHYNSTQRQRHQFVSVNCAALSETLLESELFGHVKGAFTGANQDRKGMFEVASSGTLFLDEVADMSLAMQAKLLRALQEGEIWRVGSPRPITVNVRIVAACNRDLSAMVATGEFRQDLFFRLNVVRIALPPLRDRHDDVILLIQHFLREIAQSDKEPVKKLSQGAMKLLLGYSWPGNIRELQATIVNACLFCDEQILEVAHFSHKPELSERRTEKLSDESHFAGMPGMSLTNMTLAALEEKAIVAVLEAAKGNKVEAAKRLGITRQTLYNKLKSLGIEVRRDIRKT